VTREDRCNQRKHVIENDEALCDCGAVMAGPTAARNAQVVTVILAEKLPVSQEQHERIKLLEGQLKMILELVEMQGQFMVNTSAVVEEHTIESLNPVQARELLLKYRRNGEAMLGAVERTRRKVFP